MKSEPVRVIPGDCSRLVDAEWLAVGGAWYVESGDSAPRIAHESMRASPHVGVSRGDLSRVVDGSCGAAGRAWWVDGGQSTPVIANEALSSSESGEVRRA